MTTDTKAAAQIRAMQPDSSRFIQQGRGYVDWKFSQVAAYLGFEGAQYYAEAMRRWHDYHSKYEGCTLDRTYQDFLCAEKNNETCHT
jgi:hypothetical protein